MDLLPPLLERRIARRQCVAFIGAGFSMPCGMPGWGKLLGEIIEFIRESKTPGEKGDILTGCEDAINSGRLPEAADRLRGLLSPADFHEVILNIFGIHNFHKAPPGVKALMTTRLKNLVTAPWAGVVTTNFDELIEYALGQYVHQEVNMCSGANPQIGSILAASSFQSPFFVKLHGTLTGAKIVLTETDYSESYLKGDSIRIFLQALMLRYHLVFIGCSLEDEIVRIRKTLAAKFEGSIPVSYGLLREGVMDAVRQDSLEKNSRIQPLLYPKTDSQHSSVDAFLAAAAVIKPQP